MDKVDFENLVNPTKKVEISKGIVVTVFPIPLEHMTDALKPLINLVQKIQEGAPIVSLPFIALEDLIQLIPISTNIDKDDITKIPSTALPEIINYMIELNLTPTVIKNWSTLLQKIQKTFPTQNIPQNQNVKDRKK